MERDDHSLRSRSEQDIGIGNRTDALADNVDLDFAVRKLFKACCDSFRRTAHVCLDDQIEFRNRTVLDAFISGFERNRLTSAEIAFTSRHTTLGSNFTCGLFIFHHTEFVACLRSTVKAENLTRSGRARFLHLLTMVIEHRTDSTRIDTANKRVTDVESTILNQDGCHRTLTRI